MASKEVELEASFKLRRSVLEYVKEMNIKTDFSIKYDKTLENIGLGGVKIIIGSREISSLEEE